MDKQQILDDLNSKIEQFLEQHGEEAASTAMQSALQNLTQEELNSLRSLTSEHELDALADPLQNLQEFMKSGAGLAWKGLKWLGKKAGQLLGIAAPAAGSMLGAAGGKMVDQDVNIADQEMDVSVVDKRVGQQLADMRKMLSDIRTILSTGLSDIDLSVDDLIGTVDPSKDVRASQSAGGVQKKFAKSGGQRGLGPAKADSKSTSDKKDSKA